MNNRQKGNYYRKRTIDYFRERGWEVEIAEVTKKIFTPKGIVNVTKDLFGADILMMDSRELVFVQVKSNRVDINKGLSALNKHKFPPFIKRWVVIWEKNSREPEIIEAEKLSTENNLTDK